jgi:hypothetical protein
MLSCENVAAYFHRLGFEDWDSLVAYHDKRSSILDTLLDQPANGAVNYR